MRIIAGRFKGRRLPSPRTDRVRPTADRVREAIFSSIEPLIHGARVLDLFAGTGAFGFEALSRGARFVVFVEKDRKTAEVLARTARTLDVEDDVMILTREALQAVKWLESREKKFRIIFLDPPYGEDWIPKLLHDSTFFSLLCSRGVVITEQDSQSNGSSIPRRLSKVCARRYGGTLIETFYRVPEHT